jgi:signal transduction histidine kinase
MFILEISFGVTAMAFAALFALQMVQNKRLARKLKKLNDENRTQVFTMSFPSKSNKELVRELNRLIHAKEAQTHMFRMKEHKLQKSISNISHDMRTPLTAVLGYVRLVNQDGVSEQDREKYMRIIEARSRALNRLIGDFYDLSRMDEGEYRLENAWVDVNKICLELLSAVYDDFINMGMEVEIDLLSNAPKILADANAIHRVLENVLGNIKKHGKDQLIVTGEVGERSLVLSFENGSAYRSERELERIFERSYTMSDSRANENTGLGLSICKTLLNQMGHDIEASYREDRFAINIIFNLERGRMS